MLKTKTKILSLNYRGSLSAPIIILCFVILTSISSITCSGVKENCCTEHALLINNAQIPSYLKIDSLTFTLDKLSSIYGNTGLYANFGFQFLNKDNNQYLSYLNSTKDSLIFINILNNSDFAAIDVSGIINSKGKYTLKFISDTLHLLEINEHDYQQFKLNSGFTLEKIYSTSLSENFRNKKLFLNSNLVVDKKLLYANQKLFTFFGSYSTKNNMPLQAWMSIDLSTGNTSRFHEFPAKYRNCEMRDFYSQIERISDSSAVVVFRKYNQITEINTKNLRRIISSDSFLFQSNFMCFDKKQEKNLAYTSKYDLLDEDNSNIIWMNDKLYLIKRLRRISKKDPEKCAILVFNSVLKHIATYLPGKTVRSRLSFGYKDGVVILNDSLTKAYYYEFKETK